MPTIISPPAGVLRPRDATFFLRWTNRSSGQSLAGHDQIVTTNSAVWQVEYTIAAAFDESRIKAFEAFIRSLHGMANIAALKVCDPYRYGAKVSPLQQQWSDGTWFSDGTGWTDGAAVQPLIVTQAAAAGANTIRVGLTDPVRPALRVGDYFSVNGWLYGVQSSASDGTVTFEPAARASIPVGTTLTTDPPVIYARLSDDDQGKRAREVLRWGASITLSFIEAFDR